MSVTGLVLTYNGERLLARCLESLDFCDRILVVDSMSTDTTVEIAKANGAEVLKRAWEGPLPQFKFGLEQIDTDWVISLDQDEYLSEELKANVTYMLRRSAEESGGDADIAGYMVNRRNWYYDRFMQHSGWYPDALFRVFRNGKMEVRADGAHWSFHALGTTMHMPGDIVHYPYESLAEQLDKINYYAESGAKARRQQARSGGALMGQLHASARFIKLYLLKQGWRDGRAGFINALCGAHYAFEKYMRIPIRASMPVSWSEQFDDLNRIAQQEAEAMRKSGKRGGVLKGFLSAKWAFIRDYFFFGGWRRGGLGYARAVKQFYLAFYKNVRACEPPPPEV